MKCVLLAAGRGLRLQRSDSKPLTQLLGLPLIERSLRAAKEGGVTEFIVVTGYQSDRVKDFVQSLGQRLQVSLTVVDNPLWQEKDNGSSLLAAREHLQEPFILAMADHLMDANAFKRLLEETPPENGVLLAVDRQLGNPLVDLEDVTRVQLDKQLNLVDIQKGLRLYNAFDTGLFLCSPGFLTALEQADAEGDSSLSAGVRKLIEQHQAKALDISGHFWIDVDDEAAFQRAENALLDNLRGKGRDGPVSRYLNRPLSARLSKWLAYTQLTPNQISLISFGLSLVAAAVMALPYYWTLALGGLLAQAASVLDGCDGEIARLKKLESDYGGWLDAVLDRYSDALILTALTLHAWQLGQDNAIFVGFLAVTGTLVLSYTADKYDGLMKTKVNGYFRLGRDVRLLIIALGALINEPLALLWLIAITMNAEAIRRMVICRG